MCITFARLGLAAFFAVASVTTTSAENRDHRGAGAHPGGGVTVSPVRDGRQGGGGGYGPRSGTNTTIVKPAPNVEHRPNWGGATFGETSFGNFITGGGAKQLSGQNVRDHRRYCHSC
jgi:hypothetical protein